MKKEITLSLCQVYAVLLNEAVWHSVDDICTKSGVQSRTVLRHLRHFVDVARLVEEDGNFHAHLYRAVEGGDPVWVSRLEAARRYYRAKDKM